MRKTTKDGNLAASLRDLAALGSPVDLSVAEAEVDVEIEQVGAVCATNVFDLQDGRAGYVIDLMITNQMSRPVRCRDIELRTPWVDSQFGWLPDPRESASDPHNYRFPGRAAPEFPRDLVLNHVLLDGGILKPGCPKRGWLLGIGRPMPDNLHQGEWIGVTLTIIAHDHAEYSTTITLGVDRAKLTQKSARKVPRESLFAKESARGFGSLNSGDVGPTPARDSLVPRQDAVHGARLGSSLYDWVSLPSRNTGSPMCTSRYQAPRRRREVAAPNTVQLMIERYEGRKPAKSDSTETAYGGVRYDLSKGMDGFGCLPTSREQRFGFC